VAGYRIDGVLGKGGMGVVYCATQLSLSRKVALKVLAAELSDDAGFRARFQREGQLQAALDHQHIVPVYEAGQTEQGLFLALRLIDGPTLKDLILERQLDPRRSLRILAQVAQALDAAHEAGLIHRDIKPQNILIERGDRVYLADFGLIKAPDEAGRLTGTGQFIGTIDYVAPEQIQGEPATAASDCYALAAVLYESLTGEVPFPRPSEAAVLHAHMVQPRPRVTEQRPDLPKAIDEVISTGMARDPAERPASAGELIRRAVRALGSTPQGMPGGQGPRLGGPPERSDGREPTGVPGLVATVASAAAAETAVASPEPAPPAAAVGTTPAQTASPPAPTGLTQGVQTPPPPSKPPAAPTSQRRLIAILAALAAVAIVAGFVIGHSSGGGSDDFANSATVGPLQLRYPSGWQIGAALPVLPGISFGDQLVLGRGSHAGLSAGEVAAGGGPTLLAPAFRARLASPLPPQDATKLGSVEAYRYSDLQVRGLAGTVTVYAVPTSAGVATIVCWASRPAAGGFQADCGRVAATLRLLGATAFPLGPSPAYGHQLTLTFDRLRAASSAPLAALRTARTPGAQASAARQVAHAYSSAAQSLAGATVSPRDRDAQAAIVGALTQLSGSYSRAAAAAQSGSAAAYARAGEAISVASAALSASSRALARLGYTVAAG
jgi:predicted Ser/Thr protein kinase